MGKVALLKSEKGSKRDYLMADDLAASIIVYLIMQRENEKNHIPTDKKVPDPYVLVAKGKSNASKTTLRLGEGYWGRIRRTTSPLRKKGLAREK